MVAEGGCASLCYRAFASDSFVRGRTALFERPCPMLVHLSSSPSYASPLSTAASGLRVPRQRSPVIHRTEPGADIASLACGSMPTTLPIKRGFRLLRGARSVRCVCGDPGVEAGDRQCAGGRAPYAGLCPNLGHRCTFRPCLNRAFTLNGQPHLMLPVFLCLVPGLRRGLPPGSQIMPTFVVTPDL